MDIVEIFELFPTQEDCIAHLEKVRWQGKPRCVYCGSTNTTPTKKNRHHCNNCNTKFSVTVGTIFHHTHLPCQKWFLAVVLMLNAKKGLSGRQLARDLKVNKDTAWRISMKIREAMEEPAQKELLTGLVEMDEAYIGGKPRKSGPGDKSPRGRGTKKTPVVGMIERGGKVRAKVMKREGLSAKKLTSLVRRNVDVSNATLITDEFRGYLGIKYIMPHKTVDHSVWYVNGNIHTNNIESFWAILKRGIIGQYHKVSLRYLPKYINEFSFRFNNREHDDLWGHTIHRALGVM